MDKKFKIFVIVALVILSVAIAGSAFIVLRMMDKNKTADVGATPVATELAVVTIEENILVNISDANGNPHVMKIVVAFGVDAKESSKEYKAFAEQVESKMIVVRDEIIQVMREQTYEMMDKMDAKDKLGDEIKERVNKLLGTEIIHEVYYGEFFVQ